MSDAPKRMSPERLTQERLDELNRMARSSGVWSQRSYKHAMVDLLNEVAAVRADYTAVASECEAWRKAEGEMNMLSFAYDTLFTEDCDHPKLDGWRALIEATRLARIATDASGALARHGGGA